IASRRFASSITFSVGTKTNSASLSTNFLISHGQATRSTLTYSRVIHFMRRLLLLWCNGLTSAEKLRLIPFITPHQRTLRRDAIVAETHRLCFVSDRAPACAHLPPSARLPPGASRQYR